MQIYRARAFTYPKKIEGKEVIGNPASVVVCEKEFPSQKKMSEIAVGEGMPITVFVRKKEGSSKEFKVRYFSFSGDEFEICGHGTMVTTKVVAEIFSIKRKIVFCLALNDKKISANIKGDVISIKIPKFEVVDFKNPKWIELLSPLSLKRSDIVAFPRCSAIGDVFLEIKSSKKLRSLKPNLKQISKYCKLLNIRGLAVTCASDMKDFDYEVRIFFPHLGIDEDVACGSCNSAIAPFWAKKLQKNSLKTLFPYNNFNKRMGGVQNIEVGNNVELSGFTEFNFLKVSNKTAGELMLTPLDHSSKQDYKLFREIVCDIDIMKTGSLFNGDIGKDDNEIRKYFLKMVKSNSAHNVGLYKIINKNNDFIGLTGLGVIELTKDDKVKTLELIYYLKRPYRNRKIGFNVSEVLLKYAFDNYPTLESILGISFFDNRPSQIIMFKLGFEYLTRKKKRGAIINFSILTKKMYEKHKRKPTEYYKKYLDEIIKKEYPVLEEADDFII